LNPTFVRSPTKVADPKVGEVYVKTESWDWLKDLIPLANAHKPFIKPKSSFKTEFKSLYFYHQVHKKDYRTR
jgi:hypothetical protein